MRVKVRAFYSLNRADIEERKGNYPPPIPLIERSSKLQEIMEAHRYMEKNSNFGKVVLTVTSEE